MILTKSGLMCLSSFKGEDICTKIYKKMVKTYYKGQNLLKGSTVNFGHVDLFFRNYFAENYC